MGLDPSSERLNDMFARADVDRSGYVDFPVPSLPIAAALYRHQFPSHVFASCVLSGFQAVLS